MSIINLLYLAVGINIIGFLIAYRFKSDKLTDFSYGGTYIILALASYLKSGHHTRLNLLALICVILWAIRLAGFLLIRILKTKKDRRFDGVRENFWKFGQFWVLQGVSVWVILLPTLLIMDGSSESLTRLGLVGLLIWAVGFSVETVADAQKFVFSQNLINKDKFINSGLWRYSRHPNYLGEILCWLGLYIFALPILSGWSIIIAIISPIYIAYLLIFVTGIPKLEAYADQKWGKNKDYQEYKKRTGTLVPFI